MTLETLAALSKLDPLTREIFVDSVLVGRSHTEIAATVGMKRQSIDRRIRSARKQLRTLIERPAGGIAVTRRHAGNCVGCQADYERPDLTCAKCRERERSRGRRRERTAA